MTVLIPTWIGGDLVAVDKLEAHQRGLRHKAVSVFVMAGEDLLIQRRALEKYHTPVCGRTPVAPTRIGAKTR